MQKETGRVSHYPQSVDVPAHALAGGDASKRASISIAHAPNVAKHVVSGAAWFLLVCALLLAQMALAAEQQVGRVVVAVGDVTAVGANGQRRDLSRGDPIYRADSLQTGLRSRAQVRFLDGGRLALRPETEMAIDEYADAAQPAAQRVSMSLRRGGFRTVTGRIGRANRRAYAVRTPYAVIGIRGTDWGAALAPQAGGADLLIVGVNDGGVTVTNNAGQIDLGDGAAFDFAQVVSAGSPPEGLSAPPEELNSSLGEPIPAEEEDGDDSGSQPGGPEGDDGSADESTEESSEESVAQDDGTSEEGTGDDLAAEDSGADDGSGAADADDSADGGAVAQEESSQDAAPAATDDGTAGGADGGGSGADGDLGGGGTEIAGGDSGGDAFLENGELTVQLDSGAGDSEPLFEFNNRCL